MIETVKLTLILHNFFMFGFMVLALIGLIISIKTTDYYIFKKRFKLLMPMYYMFFASLFFTGIIVLTINHFLLTFSSLFMLVVWFIILTTGIKAYKKSKNLDKKDDFIKFAQKKYSIDILITLIAFGITIIF